MILAERLLEAIDLDRRGDPRPDHLLFVVRLAGTALGLGLVAGLGVAAAGALVVRLAVAFLAGCSTAWEAGATTSAASAGAGPVPATSIVLESVRWQVSHVTVARTNVPRCRSSRRSVRGRPQNEQNATSVVTLTWPGRLFMSPEITGLGSGSGEDR